MARRRQGFQPNVPYEDDEEPEAPAQPTITKEEVFVLPETNFEIEGNTARVTRLVLTPDIVAVAIYEARGLLSVAARKLGTSVRTVKKFVRDYDICAVAAEEADEMLLDFAEAKLMQKIKSGDIASIIFYLRTKGKHRGYTERQVENADKDRVMQEEAQREAFERQQIIMGRLQDVGSRLREMADIDLGSELYGDSNNSDNSQEDSEPSDNGDSHRT